ncbi:MAG: pyruvate synthase subunit PorD [Thermofilaceae archaeon]
MSSLLSWRDLGIGCVISEPGTSVRYRTGDWRAHKPIIDQTKCIKCLLCWTYCPEPAITRHDDDRVEINYDYCKGCGICVNECPAKAIKMIPEEV